MQVATRNHEININNMTHNCIKENVSELGFEELEVVERLKLSELDSPRNP